MTRGIEGEAQRRSGSSIVVEKAMYGVVVELIGDEIGEPVELAPPNRDETGDGATVNRRAQGSGDLDEVGATVGVRARSNRVV